MMSNFAAGSCRTCDSSGSVTTDRIMLRRSSRRWSTCRRSAARPLAAMVSRCCSFFFLGQPRFRCSDAGTFFFFAIHHRLKKGAVPLFRYALTRKGCGPFFGV